MPTFQYFIVPEHLGDTEVTFIPLRRRRGHDYLAGLGNFKRPRATVIPCTSSPAPCMLQANRFNMLQQSVVRLLRVRQSLRKTNEYNSQEVTCVVKVYVELWTFSLLEATDFPSCLRGHVLYIYIFMSKSEGLGV